jgi:hypothetical protein
MARRFLRMGLCLMRTSQIYLPTHLRNLKTKPQERADYYLALWPYLKDKWNKLGALKAAFAKNRPLGQWRQIIQELYDIKLSL